MSVVVKKTSPVVVRPSEPVKTTTNATTMKLSSFDVDLIDRAATALLVFDHPLHDAAETIKRALSQALVHYYPIAGRIVAVDEDDDELHILCNGEGVAFVAASADCALKDAKFIDRGGAIETKATTTILLDELVVFYPDDRCGPTDPLLLMQVTEFSCGGFVLGVTWSHGIADGTGMAQFLQAVGELARRSSSPSVTPVRSDDSLPNLPPSLTALMQLVKSLEPLDLACHVITIPSTLTNRIRARFLENSVNGDDAVACTMFEAVVAVLWQCRTRAIMSSSSDSSSLSLLSFPACARKHVGAKDGYYGNCMTQQLVMATCGEVANANTMDLIKMIKRAKDEIPSLLLSKNGEGYDHLLQSIDMGQIGRVQYNSLNVSSWRNLGFDQADFGTGTPAKVMGYARPEQSLPFCVISPPCKGGKEDVDGTVVFSVCVMEEHADAFLKELESFT
ncbi:hypothetical protein HU200_005261 [Digitaria exilis]|uniref:Uncharacterized protein n=1 Tax=Digitaria exilis TaxID=1010633 RepID=A0A835FR86_9POAL|nr:hypothetical protein HU200_005261 [Digitaria exilis]